MSITSVTRAEQVILKDPQPLRIATRPLAEANDHILAENLIADRDQPAADRSSMDGIALAFKAWERGETAFEVQGIQAAGQAPQKLKSFKHCFEIMTGAVLPQGCDCVVPVELVEFHKQTVHLDEFLKIKPGQFVRKQASEYAKGEVLLKVGAILRAPAIALAGSIGKAQLKIFLPKIAVIGTGDELFEVSRPVKSYQARRSNAYAVEALLKRHGFTDVQRFHWPDHLAQVKKGLKKVLAGFDVIVLSGGVSMGKFDLIPAAMQAEGVRMVFHKVSQKPGNPLWFGRTPKKQPVFALPGNPVSTLVCAARYVIPYLQAAAGIFVTKKLVKLSDSVNSHPDLTLFVPVKIDAEGRAKPLTLAGSGDYHALAQSDGFVEIPAGQKIKSFEKVRFFSW